MHVSVEHTFILLLMCYCAIDLDGLRPNINWHIELMQITINASTITFENDVIFSPSFSGGEKASRHETHRHVCNAGRRQVLTIFLRGSNLYNSRQNLPR